MNTSVHTDSAEEIVANEMLAFIRLKMAQNASKPEIVKVLGEIEANAQRVREKAEAGHYAYF